MIAGITDDEIYIYDDETKEKVLTLEQFDTRSRKKSIDKSIPLLENKFNYEQLKEKFFSSDGYFLVLNYEFVIKVVSILNGEVILMLDYSNNPIRKVLLTEDNSRILILSYDNLRCYYLETKELIYSNNTSFLNMCIGNNLLALYDDDNITIIDIYNNKVVREENYDFYYGGTELQLMIELDEKMDFHIIQVLFSTQLNEFVILGNLVSNEHCYKILNLDLEVISTIQGYNLSSVAYLSYGGDKIIFFVRTYFKVFDILTGKCIHIIRLSYYNARNVYINNDLTLNVNFKDNTCIYDLENFEETDIITAGPNRLLREIIPITENYGMGSYLLK